MSAKSSKWCRRRALGATVAVTLSAGALLVAPPVVLAQGSAGTSFVYNSGSQTVSLRVKNNSANATLTQVDYTFPSGTNTAGPAGGGGTCTDSPTQSGSCSYSPGIAPGKQAFLLINISGAQPSSVSVTAHFSDGSTQSLTANTCPAITISPPTLPDATVNTPYSQQLSGSGGTGPYTFAYTGGLPGPPMSFSASGLISGTPNGGGKFIFYADGSDANACHADPIPQYTLTINDAPIGGAGKYDLKVTVDAPATASAFDPFIRVAVTVENTAAATVASPAAEVGVLFYQNLGAVRLGSVAGDVRNCRPNGGEELCDIPALAPGSAIRVSVMVPPKAEIINTSGIAGALSEATCDRAKELDCENNKDGKQITVPAPIPDIEKFELAPALNLEGSSQRSVTYEPLARRTDAAARRRGPKVKRVEIALLRRRGKVIAAASQRCLWLKSRRRASFKSVKPNAKKVCNKAVWLRASGTDRWRFKSKVHLPKGSYVLYARAIDAAGHTTSIFTRKRHNRVAFRVR